MDRSWINKNRTSVEYENGVEEFLKFASSRVSASNGDGRYYCPCVKCLNDKLFSVREIREHVICDGFNKKYTRWIWHDVLKVLWIEAADITKPKNCCIEAGIVSLTRAYVSINQMDIMGLLAAGTVSVPVMKFYNKCLYNVLVSSGRADKYGLMCPLAIQSHGNNEEMGLIRNRIGEGGFDCFLLPFYDKGWELMALCPKSGCIASFCCQGKGKKHKKKFTDMIDTAIETYQVVKGMRSNTLSKPKWVYPKCCNKDAVDPECGLFVMRHMLELIKLDIVNSFEQVLHMDKPYSSDDIADVRRSWAKCFLDDIR
ncbi:hypothetical protein CASFOL_004955 [Castilleja foliolosa]|uniref:Transposase-associated domain-containing protein n=1 Tax=Castilleja foliolosa TaxID=1961234 RepID=A0ABD3E145_9LAMI